MKTFNRILIFVITAMLFTACGPKVAPPTPVSHVENPYAPQASDSALMRGDITIDSASLKLAKSQPPHK